MPISAGELRHRVQIQERRDIQDPVSGATAPQWITVFAQVPARIADLSTRDLIAAQAVQSEVSTRITIRFRDGIKATHRILHGARVFNIEGKPLRDVDSGLEYLTIPVSEGVNEGN